MGKQYFALYLVPLSIKVEENFIHEREKIFQKENQYCLEIEAQILGSESILSSCPHTEVLEG